MQVLVEEINSAPLCPFQAFFLLGIGGVATRRKSVLQTWEVHVLPRYTGLRQCLKCVLLQLFCVLLIKLRGQKLSWHLDPFNLRLLDNGRVRGGDGVDERWVGSQLKDSPTSVALKTKYVSRSHSRTSQITYKANGCDFRILRLERLRMFLDLGPANLLVIAANECPQVGILGLFRVRETFGV